MTTSTTSPTIDTALADFDATTSRWGRLTMLAGLCLSLAGPLWLLLTADLGVTTAQIVAAFLAVAASFGVFWVLEPLTYYPILGPAAMYQAFMIGNISNKLLPAALVAQSSLGVKPGTKKGDLTSVLAICGAATVHLTSLLIFVGIFGSYLLSIMPADVIEVVRTYILPALMGAVLVQAIATLHQLRPTVIAVVVALSVQFLLIPVWGDAALYGVAITVFATVILSWLSRDRSATLDRPSDPTIHDEAVS
jgi:hypothetical protein